MDDISSINYSLLREYAVILRMSAQIKQERLKDDTRINKLMVGRELLDTLPFAMPYLLQFNPTLGIQEDYDQAVQNIGQLKQIVAQMTALPKEDWQWQ
jgi:hypothetical protein